MLVPLLAACGSSAPGGDPGPGDLTLEEVSPDVPADLPGDLPADARPDDAPDAPPADLPPDGPADAADLPPADAPADAPPADLPPDGPPDTPLPPPLTPDEIGFEDVTPPWGGSVIYFNTWSMDGAKDAIWMMDPANPSHRVERLRAVRVWAFGVAGDGTLAFSCADPLKDTHYPDLANWWDVIQYTFVVRPGEAPVQVSNGRVNDECHQFSPDGKTLFLCRRAGFWRTDTQFFNDPYRVVRLDLDTLQDTWLTPRVPMVEDNNAVLRDDGTLIFTRFYDDTREAALWTMNADGTGAALALDGAHRAVTSADGRTAWFRKSGDGFLWRADAHQLGASTKVLSGNGRAIQGVAPSPDGTMLAYELYDSASSCSDLMLAPSDGTGTPTVLVDCSRDGLFVAGVRWVQLPGTIPEPVPDTAEPAPEATEPAPDAAEAVEPAPDVLDAGTDAGADAAPEAA